MAGGLAAPSLINGAVTGDSVYAAVTGGSAAIYANPAIVWPHWITANTIVTTGNATSTATAIDLLTVWPQWIQTLRVDTARIQTFPADTAITTGNLSTNVIWTIWVQTAGPAVHVHRETEAERVARETREAQARDLAEEQRARRVRADQAAEALLVRHLNEVQREQFRKDRHFEILSKDGKRRYRIRHGWGGNVDVFDPSGKPIERLCIHPTVPVPYADNMLAQKLLLEADETEFRRIANVTRLAS